MCIGCPYRTQTPECHHNLQVIDNPYCVGERIAVLYKLKDGSDLLVFGKVFRMCENLVQIDPDGGNVVPFGCSGGFCFCIDSGRIMPEEQYDWALSLKCLSEEWLNAKIYEPNYPARRRNVK